MKDVEQELKEYYIRNTERHREEAEKSLVLANESEQVHLQDKLKNKL